MSTAEIPPTGLEITVAEDGSIPAISAKDVARLGVRPGAHLRLIPDVASEAVSARKSAVGILKGKINAQAISEGLRQAKDERIASVEDAHE